MLYLYGAWCFNGDGILWLVVCSLCVCGEHDCYSSACGAGAHMMDAFVAVCFVCLAAAWCEVQRAT